MKNTAKFAMGAGLSATVSYIWTLIPNSNTFALADNPLAFLEHYHWGLVSLNLAKHVRHAKSVAPYLNGFGVGMIVIEGASPQPFAVGKVPWQVVPSVGLGVFLTATYLLL